MSVRSAYAPPPLPVYTWTGIYWGANIGYSWGKETNTATLFGGSISESQKLDGVIGGIQTGYNYQFGTWVWGLELTFRPQVRRAARRLGCCRFPLQLCLPSISCRGSGHRVSDLVFSLRRCSCSTELAV